MYDVYVCMFSVFMGHKESLGMRLCPWPIYIFDVSVLLVKMNRNDKKVYPYLLGFPVGHSNYPWTVLSYPVTHWPLKLFTWFFFTHFQCTGYLHIQMLIPTRLSDSPIIIFNTVVQCIRLFNPMPYAQVFLHKYCPELVLRGYTTQLVLRLSEHLPS